MTAITSRKRTPPLEVFLKTANSILLRVPVDAVRGRHDRAPEKGRRLRKLLRALVAYKNGKKK